MLLLAYGFHAPSLSLARKTNLPHYSQSHETRFSLIHLPNPTLYTTKLEQLMPIRSVSICGEAFLDLHAFEQ